MLFIVDEASGVADPIMEAILGTLSGANNKLLMCGNPTKTSGTFYDSHTCDRGLYKCHRVSSRDSSRTNKENIAAMERKYGKDSNFVRVRVDGEFPKQEDDVFIPMELILTSTSSVKDFEEPEIPDLIHIGCDVARFGDDKTVIGSKVNEKADIVCKRQGQDTMKTADDIVMCYDKLLKKYPKYKRPVAVKIDDGGVGGGVVDRLRQMKRSNPQRFKQMEIFPVKFGQRMKHAYYYDSTTYMMSVVRNLLSPHDEDGKPKPVELILPDDADLIAQLSTRKYEMTDDSRQRVESKDAIKKRGGHSPDEADCILLCCLPVKFKKKEAKNLSKKKKKVRAEIIKTTAQIKKSDSPSHLEEKEDSGYSDWLEPDYTLKGLENMTRHSSILPQCISAYKSNIAGFGIGVRYKEDVTDTEELEDEFNRLSDIVELLALDCDTKEVFEKVIAARETYGTAYLEIIRNRMDEVVQIEFIENVPSVKKIQTV